MICDRQTDGQTDRRPGINNMSPDPKGGRHKKKRKSAPATKLEGMLC